MSKIKFSCDNSNTESSLVDKFNQIYDFIKTRFLFLNNSLYILESFFKYEDKEVFKSFPAYFNAVNESLVISIITTIDALYDKTSEVSIFKLINLVKSSWVKIFPQKYFYEYQENGKNCIEENIHDEKPNIIAEKCEKYLQDNENLIHCITTARDRIYCHFDKVVLNDDKVNEITENLFLMEIKKLIENTSEFIRTLYIEFTVEGKDCDFKYINQDDCEVLYKNLSVCIKYKNDIKQIMAKERTAEIDKFYEEKAKY